MTTATWLQLLGTIVLLAITWGGVQARLKQVEKISEKTAEDFGKSRNGQGVRIGVVEERLARLEGSLEAFSASGPYRSSVPPARRNTRPVPIVAEGEG